MRLFKIERKKNYDDIEIIIKPITANRIINTKTLSQIEGFNLYRRKKKSATPLVLH